MAPVTMAEPERGRGRGERRVSGKIAEKEDEGGRQEVVVDGGGVHHQIDAKNGSIRGKKGREGLQSHYHGKGENHFPLSRPCHPNVSIPIICLANFNDHTPRQL